MFNNRNTLIDNITIKDVLSNIFIENGYEILNQSQLEKRELVPEQYVLTRARYTSIYGHNTSSDFLIVNFGTNLRLRVEIKFQKLSGSVDEKLPYLYINSVSSHIDDVLFIVEGNGFKLGAKKWLKEQVNNKWLNKHNKRFYMENLAGSIRLIEELI